MTIEQVLAIWNQYNTVIIEGLVGLIIVLSLFLGYYSFFGKSSAEGTSSSGGVDTAQLEKTLQKILSAQSSRSSGHHEDLSMDLDVDDMGGTAAKKTESSQEVEKLKNVLTDQQKIIEELQDHLAAARESAQAAPVVSGNATISADAGISAAERNELATKIKELESRLAEYEIISEDIADLSRYKDENETLKAELQGRQKTPSAGTEEFELGPVKTTPEETLAVPEPELGIKSDSASDLVDDELMKEFAAAVEGQKALDKVGEKAGSGSIAVDKKSEETSKLMDEFENFVAKKS